jgi:Ca-activated chloride channel family protein
MEFIVQAPGSQAEKVRLLDGEFKVSISSQSEPVQSVPLRLSRPVADSTKFQTPPEEILRALSHLSLYRLQEQARREVAAGKYAQASRHLQRLATHLLEQGQRGLARTALLEAENIQRKKKFTREGEKHIKYGTRALLLSGQEEDQP